MMAKNNTQRALVLQGGGALGAYEAGVYSVLYNWINDNTEKKQNDNIFDIIAGTSIGAINAAFLVSHELHLSLKLLFLIVLSQKLPYFNTPFYYTLRCQ